MFNSDGLHFVAVEGREILRSFGYADIKRWGGSSRKFSLVIWDQDTEDTFEMVRSSLPPAPSFVVLQQTHIAHPLPPSSLPRTPLPALSLPSAPHRHSTPARPQTWRL